MSSGGSNLEPIAPGDEIQSLKLVSVESSGTSPKDHDACSIQTSDMVDEYQSARAERLVSDHSSDPTTRRRRDLAKTIIRHDYPLSIVNHRGFKTLFFGVYPAVSQSTLKSEILKIYKYEKSRSMALFEETPSRIAITTHKWVSFDQTKRFVAITGHLIDDDWKVRHCMMRFATVPCSYTSDLLAKITVECLFDWEVTPKLSTIAIGNSSSDLILSDILIDKLSSTTLLLGGKLLRTECFAHVVSLMVQDAFAVIANVIDKIRDSILFWAATPQREGGLQEASRELGISISDNKLVLDSVSKWNTTFLMLEKALVYKTVFCHLKKSESQFSCTPSEEEWELLKEICEKVELLYDYVRHVSEYNYANLGLMPLSQIKVALSEWTLCDNMEVREMASKMLEKFDKYWLLVRDTFAVASVLDPRFKLKFVKFCFQKIYGGEAESETEHIRRICYDLFNEYRAKLDLEKANKGDNTSSSSLEDSEKDTIGKRLSKMYRRDERKRKREQPQKHELDAYLESDRIRTCGDILDYNPLSWWKWTSECRILKKMARDFMAIPISSVPPENMFDIGDSILSPHRSKLHPAMVETLMCAQSSLWTNTKGSYSITNSYSWVTNYDYAAVEDHAVKGAKAVQS